jgi:hypothetical protein
MQERTETGYVASKMDAIQTEVQTSQEMLARMEDGLEANNEKFEVLKDILVYRLNAYHAKTKAIREELMAAIKPVMTGSKP